MSESNPSPVPSTPNRPATPPITWSTDPDDVGGGSVLETRSPGTENEIDAFVITSGGWEIAGDAPTEAEARREVEIAITAVEAYRAGAADILNLPAFRELDATPELRATVGDEVVEQAAKLLAEPRARVMSTVCRLIVEARRAAQGR